MKTNSEQRAKVISMCISKIRKELKLFSYKELTNALKECGCPYYQYIPKILIKTGNIVKINSVYIFPLSVPVHYSKIQKELDIICEEYFTKKKDSIEITPNISTKEMISHLRKLGYKISIPKNIC